MCKTARRAHTGLDGAAGLRREALATRHAGQARTAGGPLATAPVLSSDTVLVFDDHHDLPTLQDLLREQWSDRGAVPAGRALAAVHALPATARLHHAAPERPTLFPLSVRQYTFLPDGLVRLLRLLDERPRALDRLECLRDRESEADTFVHGDFKPDNLLLGGPEDQVTVLDWELAGLGGPVEDLASFASGVFALSLQTLVGDKPSTDHDEVRQALLFSAQRSWSYLALFLLAYQDAAARPVELTELVEVMALKVLCRAQSATATLAEGSAVSSLLLMAACGLAVDPAGNAEHLRAEMIAWRSRAEAPCGS